MTRINYEPAALMSRIVRLAAIARVMDTAIHIPGTGIRLGADSVLGLVPGIGDAAGALVGLYIVNEARTLGLPRTVLAKMIYNLGLDTAVGAIPVVGDVFDVYFKSHKRNVQLILDHFEITGADIQRHREERRSFAGRMPV
ncbi:DUF4112 domain-containing protein [Pararhizobium sp.]|uniref:DUF4112 domain-containing protein n=1 Tax=Pararhizobium sp. TaxID=1977563 RepID=UPI00271BA66C|nr:DUF4112 domain-containing protein [Pararhizobium sp.]MDO9416333.1 DUF4112 domain-containing protein [Pararhizobium sp.]